MLVTTELQEVGPAYTNKSSLEDLVIFQNKPLQMRYWKYQKFFVLKQLKSLFDTFTQEGFLGIDRSSRSQVLFKIGVLKYFAKFTGKHLC